MKRLIPVLALFAILLLSMACSDSNDSNSSDGDFADGDTIDSDLEDGDSIDSDLSDGDAETEQEAAFEPHPTFASRPNDPSAETDLESCAIYQQERCEGGEKKVCAIYDTATDGFVDAPDDILNRVYLYDRWHDLYTSPNGLAAERVFNTDIPGSMPESEWGDAAKFAGWAGTGDAAIWTGAALVSNIFRYMVTGTPADYTHMTERLKALLRNFEVTGIPGYLARHHYLVLDEGGPQNDQIMIEYGLDKRNNRDNPIEEPEAVEGLPPMYFDGVPDGEGGLAKGTPYWNGHPSIDQYSGPMTAFPLIYNILKEEDQALKDKIVHNMTCYMKRLKRMELINLQDNPKVLKEVTEYFAGANMHLDPDDMDFSKLDRLVVYYHANFNQANADTFDRSCPDTLELEPSRIIDASSNFMLDMLKLADEFDGDSDEPAREKMIDHFYIANVRGGDASHLMHLALMNYYFTGDQQYLDFLFDELIDGLSTIEVAKTMMAFRLPDWCFRFYGDHISYGTHWQMITMLPESELKDEMLEVMKGELWEKALYNHESAKFNTMYASVFSETDENRAEAIVSVVAQLADFGGNDGVKDAPRRTYTRDRQSIIDAFPSNISLRCPSEEERNICEDGGDLFGIPLESSEISYECDGRPGECTMEDGKCIIGLASSGLPASLRAYSDFMWQRSPFDIGDSHGGIGRVQSPGRDFTEAFWMASYYGFIDNGDGQFLAWKNAGSCN